MVNLAEHEDGTMHRGTLDFRALSAARRIVRREV